MSANSFAATSKRPFATLGHEWETLAIGFKPYPCCHYNHAYLDCALDLRHEHGLAPEAIAAVECRVPAGQVPIVCEPRAAKLRPRTAYDAQFSLPYSVASALLDGRIGLDTYAPARLTDARRLALAERVTHVIDPDSPFPRGFPGWVRVRLTDGRLLEARGDDRRLECRLVRKVLVEGGRADSEPVGDAPHGERRATRSQSISRASRCGLPSPCSSRASCESEASRAARFATQASPADPSPRKTAHLAAWP